MKNKDATTGKPDYLKAIAAYNEAIKYNTGWADGYYKIGIAYSKMRNFDQAITYMNQAYDKTTDESKKVSYKLKVVDYYLKKEQPDQAMTELNVIKARNSSDARVMFAEGNIWWAKSQFENAYTAYNNAASKDSGNMRYKAMKAAAAFKTDKKDVYVPMETELKQSPTYLIF